MRHLSRFLSLALLTAVGCSDVETDADDTADDADDCFTCDGKADALGLSGCQVEELLAFVSSADVEVLDHDVPLDVRAARGIAERGEFSTLAELDAVPYVGAVAFRRLRDYAAARELLACDDTIDLVEGDPNTEFGETFIALQEEATGDCLPFGGAFSYDRELEPTDATVAASVADIFAPGSDRELSTGLSRDDDLGPFLESFGFDVPGLHGAIGFSDYELARVVTATDETMVLHYRERSEVWTVTLSCSP